MFGRTHMAIGALARLTPLSVVSAFCMQAHGYRKRGYACLSSRIPHQIRSHNRNPRSHLVPGSDDALPKSSCILG